VAVLLSAGADPAATNPDDHTALQLAARKGNLEVMEALLDSGISVDGSNPLGTTALHSVALTPQIAAAEFLLKRGANPNARGGDAQTPLHVTAFSFQAAGEMAGLLIDHGARLNARNKYRATPLLLAAIQGNLPVIRVLLERGADPDLESMNEQTPLEAARAAKKNKAAELLESASRG